MRKLHFNETKSCQTEQPLQPTALQPRNTVRIIGHTSALDRQNRPDVCGRTDTEGIRSACYWPKYYHYFRYYYRNIVLYTSSDSRNLCTPSININLFTHKIIFIEFVRIVYHRPTCVIFHFNGRCNTCEVSPPPPTMSKPYNPNYKFYSSILKCNCCLIFGIKMNLSSIRRNGQN